MLHRLSLVSRLSQYPRAPAADPSGHVSSLPEATPRQNPRQPTRKRSAPSRPGAPTRSGNQVLSHPSTYRSWYGPRSLSRPIRGANRPSSPPPTWTPTWRRWAASPGSWAGRCARRPMRYGCCWIWPGRGGSMKWTGAIGRRRRGTWGVAPAGGAGL